MDTTEFFRRQVVSLAYRQLPAAELLTRAAAGDVEAFIALVCLKYPVVTAACRNVLGPAGGTEDVAQDVFVQLWRQREMIRSADAIDGWLTQTARNLALKSVSREAKGLSVRTEWWLRHGREAGEVGSPEETAIKAEFVRLVRQVIAVQPEGDQQVLRAVEQAEDDGQAAESLELSVGAYRVRLHRARQKLRKLLKKAGLIPGLAIGTAIGATKRAAAAVAVLWGRRLGKLLLLTCAVAAAGVVGGIAWLPRSVPPPVEGAQAPPPAVASGESATRERLRMDRVFAPVLAEIEAGLKQMALGNKGGARFREMRYDSQRPAALFDWWFKHENDGKIAFEKRFIIEVGYGTNLDEIEAYYYADGIDGPKKKLDPENPIIPYISTDWGIKWSLKLPWFQRAIAAMEGVRTAYAVDKDRLDEAAKPAIAKLEVMLKQMVRGNEGTVQFDRLRYPVNQPAVMLRWRHRQVTGGRVVYDREQWFEIVYLAEYHKVYIAYWQTVGPKRIWRWLTPESNFAIFPESPVGDTNPRLPAELLRDVPEILNPIVRLYHPTDRLPPAIVVPE